MMQHQVFQTQFHHQSTCRARRGCCQILPSCQQCPPIARETVICSLTTWQERVRGVKRYFRLVSGQSEGGKRFFAANAFSARCLIARKQAGRYLDEPQCYYCLQTLASSRSQLGNEPADKHSGTLRCSKVTGTAASQAPAGSDPPVQQIGRGSVSGT